MIRSNNIKLNDPVEIERKNAPCNSPSTLQGIVAFFGLVSFADKDDWVGIRLTGDSIGHGLNDGAVHGVRYFDNCGQRGGIFVRLHAIKLLATVRKEKVREKTRSGGSGGLQLAPTIPISHMKQETIDRLTKHVEKTENEKNSLQTRVEDLHIKRTGLEETLEKLTSRAENLHEEVQNLSLKLKEAEERKLTSSLSKEPTIDLPNVSPYGPEQSERNMQDMQQTPPLDQDEPHSNVSGYGIDDDNDDNNDNNVTTVSALKIMVKIMESENRNTKEKIDVIFDSCNVDLSGHLDMSELRYALQAFGFYPEDQDINAKMKELDLKLPLNNLAFRKIKGAMETNGCVRKLAAVPYARRGLSLRQLKGLRTGLLETGWLSSRCEKFNKEHDVAIRENKKIEMAPNFYAVDEFFVQDTTSADARRRKDITQEVLKSAEVPNAPKANCCFAQLLNPEGLQTDYFVSHYWGRPFGRTVLALSNFAEGVYENIGKSSPDHVVFWICLFSLNQHQAAEEVGATPEEGPFNAALAKAQHGAVMVLDGRAEPMRRIWCLYEVGRAKDFNKQFQLIVDDGELAKASDKTLEEISESLLKLRASDATASRESDKYAIHYQILDPAIKRVCTSFEMYEQRLASNPSERAFRKFDLYICSLIGTPMFAAGLKAESRTVCMRAIGMGAKVTVADLEELTQRLSVDLNVKVDTRFGRCGLALVFARMGREDELKYVLDNGAEDDEKDESGMTTLLWAAKNGHANICTLLLDRWEEVNVKDGDGMTSDFAHLFGHAKICTLLLNRDDIGTTTLHFAARNGHANICTLLLDRGVEVNTKNNGGCTALHFAAMGGHANICVLLLDRGAEVDAKDNKNGSAALHLAATTGHAKICTLLLNSGAEVDVKNKNGLTALHIAAMGGYAKICTLLLERGADVDVKDDDGWTALHNGAGSGHVEVCRLLLERGAEVNVKPEYREMPYQLAAKFGHMEVVKLLLESGAKVED